MRGRDYMKFTLITVVAIIAFLLSGCVSVSYLPTDETHVYAPTNSLKVYWEKPDFSYAVIGMIISEDYGEEEKLFSALKKKAMSIGAHGIIMKPPIQQTEIYGYSSPYTRSISSNRRHRLEAFAIRFNKP